MQMAKTSTAEPWPRSRKANIARINDNVPLRISTARPGSCGSRVNPNTTCSAPLTTRNIPNTMDATTIEGFGQASTAAPKHTDNSPDASTDFHERPNWVGTLDIMPTQLTGR